MGVKSEFFGYFYLSYWAKTEFSSYFLELSFFDFLLKTILLVTCLKVFLKGFTFSLFGLKSKPKEGHGHAAFGEKTMEPAAGEKMIF